MIHWRLVAEAFWAPLLRKARAALDAVWGPAQGFGKRQTRLFWPVVRWNSAQGYCRMYHMILEILIYCVLCSLNIHKCTDYCVHDVVIWILVELHICEHYMCLFINIHIRPIVGDDFSTNFVKAECFDVWGANSSWGTQLRRLNRTGAVLAGCHVFWAQNKQSDRFG